MLNFIKAKIQEILDTVGVANTTLKTVQIVTEKSDERTVKEYYDHETLLLVARELPSLLPQLPVADRFTSISITAHAVETEKAVVDDVINEFIDTYNGTKQSSIGGIFYFTNLVPTGVRENIGAYRFGSWSFAITYRELSGITSIYDREIQYAASDSFENQWEETDLAYYTAQSTDMKGTSAFSGAPDGEDPVEDAADYAIGFCMRVMNEDLVYDYFKVVVDYASLGALNGLVSFSLTLSNVFTSLPSEGGYDLVLEAKKGRVQFVFLDSVDAVAQALKTLGYACSSDGLYINAVSGGASRTLYAKLIDFNDTANTQGFPVCTMIFEGKVV